MQSPKRPASPGGHGPMVPTGGRDAEPPQWHLRRYVPVHTGVNTFPGIRHSYHRSQPAEVLYRGSLASMPGVNLSAILACLMQRPWSSGLLLVLIAATWLTVLPAMVTASTDSQEMLPSAREVYNLVSHGIPYIETPSSQGSGVLIEHGGEKYVITNSHVLWPYQEAYVHFPDGSDFDRVALVDWDLLADIAVLGPIETDLDGLELDRRVEAQVGDVAYLLGYPYESDYAPQPTMAQGIVSRLRQWEIVGLSYIQTDAATAPGQSGGVLVAGDGKILGLSTYIFDEEGAFTLALSSPEVRRRATQVIRGFDADLLGERRTLLDDRDDSESILIEGWRYGHLDYTGDVDIFVVELQAGQQVVAWAESFAMNPVVAIGPLNAHEADLISDPLYGYEVFFEVPEDGEYLVMVRDAEADDTGAYLVGVYEW